MFPDFSRDLRRASSNFRLLKRFSRAVLVAAALLGGCAPRPSRIPPDFIPQQSDVREADERYGHAVLSMLTKRYMLDRDDARINRVRGITDKLTAAARADFNPWHVYVLVDDNFQNAAATRGNYIFVWTGMLKAVRDDGELATVLSHEIGHLLAGHTKPSPLEEVNEILSGIGGLVARQTVLRQGQAVIMADLAELVMREALKAFLVNPEAQRKELEADQIGLSVMAEAGYDPATALLFWERKSRQLGFSVFPLQFMSSHPNSDERIKLIRRHLPAALERYYSRLGNGKRERLKTSPDEWNWGGEKAKGGQR